MKLEISVIDKGIVKEYYEYSSESFLYNDNEIEVINKDAKLFELISMTMNWDDYNSEEFYSGYKVNVTMDKYNKNYVIDEHLPNNFLMFMYEIRRIAKGEK